MPPLYVQARSSAGKKKPSKVEKSDICDWDMSSKRPDTPLPCKVYEDAVNTMPEKAFVGKEIRFIIFEDGYDQRAGFHLTWETSGDEQSGSGTEPIEPETPQVCEFDSHEWNTLASNTLAFFGDFASERGTDPVFAKTKPFFVPLSLIHI